MVRERQCQFHIRLGLTPRVERLSKPRLNLNALAAMVSQMLTVCDPAPGCIEQVYRRKRWSVWKGAREDPEPCYETNLMARLSTH
jgi:hypothetical protein